MGLFRKMTELASAIRSDGLSHGSARLSCSERLQNPAGCRLRSNLWPPARHGSLPKDDRTGVGDPIGWPQPRIGSLKLQRKASKSRRMSASLKPLAASAAWVSSER